MSGTADNSFEQMNYLKAGFATPKVATLASAGNTAPLLKSATMCSMSLYREAAIQRLTNTIHESAITSHQMDFERVGRRSGAIDQLKGTIIELKSRVERKSSGLQRLTAVHVDLQLSSKAS